jgi:hypothetical protein
LYGKRHSRSRGGIGGVLMEAMGGVVEHMENKISIMLVCRNHV